MVANGDIAQTTSTFLKYHHTVHYWLVAPEKVVCHSDGEWSQVPSCKGTNQPSPQASESSSPPADARPDPVPQLPSATWTQINFPSLNQVSLNQDLCSVCAGSMKGTMSSDSSQLTTNWNPFNFLLHVLLLLLLFNLLTNGYACLFFFLYLSSHTFHGLIVNKMCRSHQPHENRTCISVAERKMQTVFHQDNTHFTDMSA